MKKIQTEKLDATKLSSWDGFLNYRTQKTKETYFIRIEFSTSQLAGKYFEYLAKILPIVDADYPKRDNNVVILSNDQFYCFQISWMHVKGELHTDFLGDQYLLKTLRADRFDFSHSFKSGLIPAENGKRYHNLRPKQRGDYTISPQGEMSSRLEKKPSHSVEEKKEYSQIQSCTYIDAQLLVDAFGFSKVREGKLYGLLTHKNDALFSRLLVRDCGTVARPFDFNNREEAVASPKVFYSLGKFGLFVEQNAQLRNKEGGTNEILARLRFNPYRTLVVICADSLESRLLAYHFAQELQQEFRGYAQRNYLQVNTQYKIPILFYLPVNMLGWRPKLLFYTDKMRISDCAQCCKIDKNPESRHQKIIAKDFEFLLGLPKITTDIFLDRTRKGNLLALEMLTNGYARILFRLLRPLQNPSDNTFCNELFDQLLRRGLIKNNDFIIGDLIMIEEFVLAEKIIGATKSDKEKLVYREYNEKEDTYILRSLEDYLLLKGNPRQIAFMGLERMLRKAVEQKRWVAIRLCVKELSSINQSILDELLSAARQQEKYAEADFLLKKGAIPTPAIEASEPSIRGDSRKGVAGESGFGMGLK